MDVVLLDPVAACRAAQVAPRPTHRNARVIAVVDQVVCNRVAVAVHHQDADGRRIGQAVVADRVVADRVVAGAQGRVAARFHAAQPETSRCDLFERVAGEPVERAAVEQFETERSEVAQRAAVERAVACA